MQNKISTVHSTAELETVVGMQWEAAQSLPKKKKPTKNPVLSVSCYEDECNSATWILKY